MTEEKLKAIADQADMIVRGYAFTRINGNITVVNLYAPKSVLVMTEMGKVLETTMNDIEEAIVQKIWQRDAKYMEAAHA